MANNISVDEAIAMIKSDMEAYRPAYGSLVDGLQSEAEGLRGSLNFYANELSMELTPESGYSKFFNNFHNRLPGGEIFIGVPSLTKITGIEEIIGRLNYSKQLDKTAGEIEEYLRGDEFRSLGYLPLEFTKNVLLPIYVELRSLGYTRDSLVN